jgi:hypothetical protein
MPFASIMYGTLARRTGTTATVGVGRGGRSGFFVQAAIGKVAATARAKNGSDARRESGRNRIIGD